MGEDQSWMDNPEVKALLPQPPPPSIGERIGHQVANLPSNIGSSLMDLLYNVGFRTKTQEGPVEVPKPYDIPEPQTAGEYAVDIGANSPESLPLFATGEGAGAGVARLAKAGPLLTRMLRVAGGFGLQGLSESRTHGITGVGQGLLFGAAEETPGLLKLLPAAGVAGATYLQDRLEGASPNASGISAAAQGLLPLLTGRWRKPKLSPTLGEAAADDFFGHNIGEPPVATSQPEPPLPNIRTQPTAEQPFLPFGAPEGSLIETGRTIQPAQPRPVAQQIDMFGHNVGDFPTEPVEAAPPNVRTQPTMGERFLPLGAPEGSLIATRDTRAGGLPFEPINGAARPPTEPVAPVAPVVPVAPRAPIAPVAPRAPILPRAPEPPAAPRGPLAALLNSTAPVRTETGAVELPSNLVAPAPEIATNLSRDNIQMAEAIASGKVELGGGDLEHATLRDRLENIRDDYTKYGAEMLDNVRFQLALRLGKELSASDLAKAVDYTNKPYATTAGYLADILQGKLAKDLPWRKAEEPKVATLQQPKKLSRILLKTVLSHEDAGTVANAAKKLGLRYDGIIGENTKTPKLQFTAMEGDAHPTIAVPSGSTYKDLKNKLAETKKLRAERLTPEQVRAKLSASQGEKGGIATSQSAEHKILKGDKGDDDLIQLIKNEVDKQHADHDRYVSVIKPNRKNLAKHIEHRDFHIVQKTNEIIHRWTERNPESAKAYQELMTDVAEKNKVKTYHTYDRFAERASKVSKAALTPEEHAFRSSVVDEIFHAINGGMQDAQVVSEKGLTRNAIEVRLWAVATNIQKDMRKAVNKVTGGTSTDILDWNEEGRTIFKAATKLGVPEENITKLISLAKRQVDARKAFEKENAWTSKYPKTKEYDKLPKPRPEFANGRYISITEKLGVAEPELKVATLQSEPPSSKAGPGAEPGSASHTSSLETGLPHGLQVGDMATVRFEDEVHMGRILGVNEDGSVKVMTKTYGELDRPASDISFPGVRPETDVTEIASGSMEDIEKLGTEPQKGKMKMGGGTKRVSTFGAGDIGGFASPEFLTKYIAGPAVGGVVGYAYDEKHRPQSAIIGALAMGLLAHGGWNLIEALAKGRPLDPKAPKVIPTSVKDEKGTGFMPLLKAIFGDEKEARVAAAQFGYSTNIERVARWVNKMSRGAIDITRMHDAAYGIAENLAKAMNQSIQRLRSFENIDTYKPFIRQYLDTQAGTLPKGATPFSFRDLQARVPAEVANHIATSVQGMEQLQQIILDSLPVGKLATKVRQSLGKYLTTTYRIFNESDYRPTFSQIEATAKSWDARFPNTTLETRIKFVSDYLKEVQSNKTLFGGLFSGEKGEELGTILAKINEKLTPEFKAMLGEYDDPLLRMGFTAMKLVNGARSAEFFNQVSRGVKANGLKYAYTTNEMEIELGHLERAAKFGATPEIQAAAKIKYDELNNYVPNSAGLKSGNLDGKWLDVKAHDQISQWDAVSKQFQSPVARGLAEATNFIKYNKLILNPLQVTRQILQIPILGAISRTGPMDWIKAFRSLRDPAEYSRLQRLGILSGDPVGGMLRRDVRSMLDGTIDRVLSDKAKRILHAWEEIWRTPDLIVRTAAFQKKEAELLLVKGMSAVEAANKAIDFTNRYTMNYGAIPPIISKGRQMPFLNQYLSWTYEALRITKNLVVDAKGGDLYAMGVLGTMAATPFFIQQMTESQLSPDDKKEWDKVKNLGPEYSRYNFKFVQGRLPNGDFKYIDYTPLVIHDQLLRMIRAGMAGDTDGVLSANPLFGWENTPLLNIATSQVAGRDRHTGDKLFSIADRAGAAWKDIAPPLASTEFDRLKNAFTANSDGTMGTMNLRTGQSNSISDILQTYVTSMRPYTLRPAYVIAQYQAETRDHIRSQQLVLRKVLTSNASESVKSQARAQYELAKNEILRAFQDRLGVGQTPQPETVMP